jgi:Effector-associated domain 11
MKQTLRNLIADGKTAKVIAELRQLTTSDADLNNEVNIIAARFTKYKTQYHLGLEDSTPLNIELNKINNALLDIIDRLPANREWFCHS